MRTGLKCLLVILGVVASLGFVALNVQGAEPEVWVDDDYDASTPGWGTTHFDAIQNAIDNVTTGGIVYVNDGDYWGTVDVDRTMSIIGNTTVNALTGNYQNLTNISHTSYGFLIMADYVNISGFSLDFIPDSLGPPYTGISISSDNCNISGNVIFGDGEADGIYLDNANDSNIFNNIFRNNHRGIVGSDNCIGNTMEFNNISFRKTDDNKEDATYYISVKQASGWTVQKELHFSRYYTIDMAELSLPDVDGDYKVRVMQQSGTAAHIDYIALQDDNGTEVSPISAISLDTGDDVLYKVLAKDNDVADVHEKTFEVIWEDAIEISRLVLMANEERRTMEIPLSTPHTMIPQLMEEHVLQNNGGFIVDGVPDELDDADFSSYWMPSTGHPWGTTYLWLQCDDEYLYALMEITSDNTYDGTGWGSLYIFTGGERKEFRITSYDHTYGLPGFVYTDKVPWQHMAYEFRIPLTDIGVAVDDTIKIGYGSYGTETAIRSGIYLTGRRSPDWNIITNNTIFGYSGASDGAGIFIGGGNYNEISYNDLFANGHGISLQDSDNNSIFSNTIHDNSEGIFMYASSNNTITDNVIERNQASSTGLYITFITTRDNEIHRNCFIDNSPQAYDSGQNNDWDGNYWSDYQVSGGTYTGILGNAGSSDGRTLGTCPLRGGQQPPCGVGGEVLPVTILELLAPYITATLAVTVLLGLAAISIRRRNT